MNECKPVFYSLKHHYSLGRPKYLLASIHYFMP
jgi:hypothetical protein